MSETTPKKYLQLSQLIYSGATEVCLDVKSGELQVYEKIPCPNGEIAIVRPIGSHTITKLFYAPMSVYERRVRPNGKGFEMIKVGETLGFKSISRQLSIVYQCTEEEIRNLIEPLLQQGMTRIFLFTLCNRLGLSDNSFFNDKFPELVEQFGRNKWCCSGSISDASPSENNAHNVINALLRVRKSPWRIRTPQLFTTKILNE